MDKQGTRRDQNDRLADLPPRCGPLKARIRNYSVAVDNQLVVKPATPPRKSLSSNRILHDFLLRDFSRCAGRTPKERVSAWAFLACCRRPAPTSAGHPRHQKDPDDKLTPTAAQMYMRPSSSALTPDEFHTDQPRSEGPDTPASTSSRGGMVAGGFRPAARRGTFGGRFFSLPWFKPRWWNRCKICGSYLPPSSLARSSSLPGLSGCGEDLQHFQFRIATFLAPYPLTHPSGARTSRIKHWNDSSSDPRSFKMENEIVLIRLLVAPEFIDDFRLPWDAWVDLIAPPTLIAGDAGLGYIASTVASRNLMSAMILRLSSTPRGALLAS